MHKRGIIRVANYTVCASVSIHFCMQRKNNENIPILLIQNFPKLQKHSIAKIYFFSMRNNHNCKA